ncbi:MAG TPA: hypothetical protein VEZ90_00250, partial [Blastocatellia bacterium]|nr:hypothetical protein [Blastocatellia bacterium]
CEELKRTRMKEEARRAPGSQTVNAAFSAEVRIRLIKRIEKESAKGGLMVKGGFLSALAVLCSLLSGCARDHSRPTNVPTSAVWVDGVYIQCKVDAERDGDFCSVYEGGSGEILAEGLFGAGYPPRAVEKPDLQYVGYRTSDPTKVILLKDLRVLSLTEASERDPTNRLIHDRLKSLATADHRMPNDCGETVMNQPDSRVSDCAESAFESNKPFFARYFSSGVIRYVSYGLASDADENVFEVAYNMRGLLNFDLGKNEQVFDDNQIRVTKCIHPIKLGKTAEGMLVCVTPIDEEASAIAAQQKPIETTVCAILDNPSAFNNRMVRIHGHFSGNFEYSELGGDGCPGSIWFTYGNGGGPPGLVAHVSGRSEPGAVDSQGKRILPIPVNLVRDAKFERFERLARAADRADSRRQETDPTKFVDHQVTATFLGRIDAVSPDIHAFHLRRKPMDRADFLGYGQMGLFDAQFVLKAVESDAVLEKQPPIPLSQ